MFCGLRRSLWGTQLMIICYNFRPYFQVRRLVWNLVQLVGVLPRVHLKVDTTFLIAALNAKGKLRHIHFSLWDVDIFWLIDLSIVKHFVKVVKLAGAYLLQSSCWTHLPLDHVLILFHFVVCFLTHLIAHYSRLRCGHNIVITPWLTPTTIYVLVNRGGLLRLFHL